MTSKEYLEHICKICDNESCPYIHYENSRCSYYGFIKKDLDRLEKLEKELKQTKLNFKNSQIHSKNCYKKLKNKYLKTEEENKKLKEIIKENFDYTEVGKYTYFKYNAPVMDEEIKEVLGYER